MRSTETGFSVAGNLNMPWLESGQIEAALEQTFNDILHTRMRGMPVLNPALTVRALGFSKINQDWCGVLITPWFMNVVLLPGPGGLWVTQAPGGKFEQSFPYGGFEFTVAHETRLGVYGQCSLFSPMFEFENQAAALTSAQTALQALLTSPAPRAVSRRDMLRGKLGSD